MALSRPTFQVNISANKRITEKKSIFYDIAPDTTAQLRILPPVTEPGMMFTVVCNHFRLKNDEGFGMALACLEEHGNDEIGTECYICNLVKHLRQGDRGDQKIAKELVASRRWYLQCLVYDEADGAYFGPKLVGLSRTTAEKVHNILASQDASGDDHFYDPVNGQDLKITRVGSGLKSRYEPLPTGQKSKLDDIFPSWNDKIITDLYKAIDLRIHDMDDQKKALLRTFGDELDWDKVQEAIG